MIPRMVVAECLGEVKRGGREGLDGMGFNVIPFSLSSRTSRVVNQGAPTSWTPHESHYNNATI